jgi:hypothetical protein
MEGGREGGMDAVIKSMYQTAEKVYLVCGL